MAEIFGVLDPLSRDLTFLLEFLSVATQNKSTNSEEHLHMRP